MAISFQNYVDITSGIGAGAVVPTRELIGRLFTSNPLVPTNSFIEFTSSDEVLAYFGSSSIEYARAVFYFAWISKNITSPQKISFASWASADTAPLIFGAPLTTNLTALNLITNGSVSLTLGATTNNLTGLNFSMAANLAACASVLQTAIRAQTGTLWTGATVTYDATRGGFNLTGGATGSAVVSVAAGTGGTNVSQIIGWLPQSINGSSGAIWSNGIAAQSITDVLSTSSQDSNNFGSFLFIPTLNISQITEAATWNNAQNISYIYTVRVANSTDAISYNAALVNIGGVCLTLAPISTEYPEMVPMMILAATNYLAVNSTQNYMFQQFNLTPSVVTTADAAQYDSLRVNYYGETQTAGQLIDFYQRGTMMGLPVNPSDMNVYANEIWLRDAAGAAVMTLLLALAKISANTQGRGQILSTLQSIIDQALNNGTISLGGFLSNTQKLYIAQITNDATAWYQVQNIGYWLNCVIQIVTTNSNTVEYHAVYTLIYKKDDVIRKVDGTHVLI